MPRADVLAEVGAGWAAVSAQLDDAEATTVRECLGSGLAEAARLPDDQVLPRLLRAVDDACAAYSESLRLPLLRALRGVSFAAAPAETPPAPEPEPEPEPELEPELEPEPEPAPAPRPAPPPPPPPAPPEPPAQPPPVLTPAPAPAPPPAAPTPAAPEPAAPEPVASEPVVPEPVVPEPTAEPEPSPEPMVVPGGPGWGIRLGPEPDLAADADVETLPDPPAASAPEKPAAPPAAATPRIEKPAPAAEAQPDPAAKHRPKPAAEAGWSFRPLDEPAEEEPKPWSIHYPRPTTEVAPADDKHGLGGRRLPLIAAAVVVVVAAAIFGITRLGSSPGTPQPTPAANASSSGTFAGRTATCPGSTVSNTTDTCQVSISVTAGAPLTLHLSWDTHDALAIGVQAFDGRDVAPQKTDESGALDLVIPGLATGRYQVRIVNVHDAPGPIHFNLAQS